MAVLQSKVCKLIILCLFTMFSALAISAQTSTGQKQIVTLDKLLSFGSLFESPKPPAPQWLPDSQRIWFERDGWVEIVDTQSGERQKLVQTKKIVFSPDSQKAAYLKGKGRESELWIITLTNKNQFRVAAVSEEGFDFRWQADGKGLICYWLEEKQAKVGFFSSSDQSFRVISNISFDKDKPQFYWSPDEKDLAYSLLTNEGLKIGVISPEAGTVRTFDAAESDRTVSSFVWSPDKAKIAYSVLKKTPLPAPEVLPKIPGTTVKIYSQKIESFEPYSDILTINVKTGERQKLESGKQIITHLKWHPNGETLYYVVRLTGATNYYVLDKNELRSLEIKEGRVKTLLKDWGLGEGQAPFAIYDISPDGKTLAVKISPYETFYPPRVEIGFISSTGGEIRRVKDNLPIAGHRTFVWSADSKKIFLTSHGGGSFRRIFSLSTDGDVQLLSPGLRLNQNLAVSPNKRLLAWGTEDQAGRMEIRVAGETGATEKMLLDLTPPERENFLTGETEEVNWKSYDGTINTGILIKPIGYQPGKRYPLLVDVHGGAKPGVDLTGPVIHNSPLERHFWAARGFMILAPDYRTSGNLGWESVTRFISNRDVFERVQEDIISGVEYLIKRGLVDENRLAVAGISHGGHVTNWIITRSDIFHAAVSYEGQADFYLAYGAGKSIGGNTFWEGILGGKPWETPENWRRNSATVFDGKKLKTPTLFVNGTTGVDHFHNQFLYTALQQQGIDTQLLIYGDEGHGIRKPENLRDLQLRVIDWIEEHLKVKQSKAETQN